MIFALATIFQLDEVSPENPTWETIRGVFNRAEVPITALPHFSWHVANEYDEDAVESHYLILLKASSHSPSISLELEFLQLKCRSFTCL